MNGTTSESLTVLDDVSTYINRYFTLAILLFGFTGNILNILVFVQRKLRSNPCGWFFLTSTIANSISILFGVTTRVLSGWDKDPTSHVHWLCKLRTYLVFSSRTIALWLITFATVDRWLVSSRDVRCRRASSLPNAVRISLFVTILSCLLHLQMFYCYEANLAGTPLQCYGKNSICRHVNDALYASITILFPLTIMLIFGLMTVLNVRHVHRHVNATHHGTAPSREKREQFARKRIDRRLLKMLLMEIVLLTVLLIPQAIQKLYSTISDEQEKSDWHEELDDFLYNLAVLLTFIASGAPFYIYTLYGGDTFRKALSNVFLVLKHRVIDGCTRELFWR